MTAEMSQRPAKLREKNLVLDVSCVGPTYRIDGRHGYRAGQVIFHTDEDLDLARAQGSKGFDLLVDDQVYRVRVELNKATPRRACPWQESKPSAKTL